MKRVLWVAGILGGVVAYLLSREGSRRMDGRGLQVGDAAEQLRRAWADHHTVA